VVSALITNPAGAILLQLRSDNPDLEYANHWTLPGGYLEPGESLEAAIRREMLEEMKLDLPWEWVGVFHSRRGKGGRLRVANHIYRAVYSGPAGALTLTEGQRVEWFSPEAVLDLPLAFSFDRFFSMTGGKLPG
jgi:8-oxo-dGTP diphosphatase